MSCLPLQEELLALLLDIPVRMMDRKLSLLAGKILLYFAENNQVCVGLQCLNVRFYCCNIIKIM